MTTNRRSFIASLLAAITALYCSVFKSKPTWWIYRMNDCDWYSGRSLKEAIAAATRDYGEEYLDDYLDEPEPLTEEEMHRLQFCDENDPDDPSKRRSFYAELLRSVSSGEIRAETFASTEF